MANFLQSAQDNIQAISESEATTKEYKLKQLRHIKGYTEKKVKLLTQGNSTRVFSSDNFRYPLFKLLSDNHDITLIDSELEAIISCVKKIINK